MKKTLSVITLLFCAIAISAQEIATIDSIKYYLDNGQATIMSTTATSSGDLKIPESVTYNNVSYTVSSISTKAFSGTTISSVTLPNSITSMGDGCFYCCRTLTSVTLPDGITSLPNECFSGCIKLTNIKLPHGITTLGNYCFDECSNLAAITLPDGITSLGEACFDRCSSLSSIALPDGITSLGEACFYGCYKITSMTIPNSVTSIGVLCFSGTGLTSISIPNSITSLPYGCFYYCTDLTSITIPSSVTTIGGQCFANCSSLTSIVLPNSITSIGDDCFSKCAKLASVTLPNSIKSLGEKYYPDGFFYKCISLTNIVLPNSITSIARNCFSGCSNLASVTLSTSLISLAEECFSGCTSLTSITLPKSVKQIDNECFKDCSSLFKVTCQWNNIDTVNVSSNAFSSIFSDAKLYVPKGTTAIYKAKTPWSDFKYIVENTDTPEEVKKCATPTISYADSKLSFASATDGASYHYTITDADIKSEAYSEDGTVTLASAYDISVIASANGYINSDKSTAKLYFVNANLQNAANVVSAKLRGIMIQKNNDFIVVSGLSENESVSLYNSLGMQLGASQAISGVATFNVNKTDNVVIVKIGNDSIKIEL